MTTKVPFQKNELVWAKIRGYPWWPGIVAKIIEEKSDDNNKKVEILVNFIGDHSHSRLQLDKLAKFKQKYEEYTQNIRNKRLASSIKIADKIHNGEISYKEVKRQQKKQNKANQMKRHKRKASSSSSDSNSSSDSSSSSESSQQQSKSSSLEQSSSIKSKSQITKQESTFQKTDSNIIHQSEQITNQSQLQSQNQHPTPNQSANGLNNSDNKLPPSDFNISNITKLNDSKNTISTSVLVNSSTENASNTSNILNNISLISNISNNNNNTPNAVSNATPNPNQASTINNNNSNNNNTSISIASGNHLIKENINMDIEKNNQQNTSQQQQQQQQQQSQQQQQLQQQSAVQPQNQGNVNQLKKGGNTGQSQTEKSKQQKENGKKKNNKDNRNKGNDSDKEEGSKNSNDSNGTSGDDQNSKSKNNDEGSDDQNESSSDDEEKDSSESSGDEEDEEEEEEYGSDTSQSNDGNYKSRRKNKNDKKKKSSHKNGVNKVFDRNKQRSRNNKASTKQVNKYNDKKGKQLKQQKLLEEINQKMSKVKVESIGDKYYLELEFNTILSSLINAQITVSEFEDTLKSLIAKVKCIKPDSNNIQKILNNDNGKNLMCVKYLLEEKRNLLENYQINVQFYLHQIESLIKSLQTQLMKKFFDYKNTLAAIKDIFKPFNSRYKKELKKLIDKPSSKGSDNEGYQMDISNDFKESSSSEQQQESDVESGSSKKVKNKRSKPLQIDDGKSNSSDLKKPHQKKLVGGRLKKQSSKAESVAQPQKTTQSTSQHDQSNSTSQNSTSLKQNPQQQELKNVDQHQPNATQQIPLENSKQSTAEGSSVLTSKQVEDKSKMEIEESTNNNQKKDQENAEQIKNDEIKKNTISEKSTTIKSTDIKNSIVTTNELETTIKIETQEKEIQKESVKQDKPQKTNKPTENKQQQQVSSDNKINQETNQKNNNESILQINSPHILKSGSSSKSGQKENEQLKGNSQQVVDKKLRKKICKCMLENLISSNYYNDKLDAQNFIMNYEQQVCKQYNNMENTYKQIMAKTIQIVQQKLVSKDQLLQWSKNVKLVKLEELKNILEKKSGSSSQRSNNQSKNRDS